jgi:uncharacterized protein (DUF924 family)
MRILDIWFPYLGWQDFWFKKDVNFDKKIKDEFFDDLKKAEQRMTDFWRYDADTCLELIILLDQFSRNIYREEFNNYQIKENDKYALELVDYYIINHDYLILPPSRLVFILLPYRHTKDIDYINKAIDIMLKLDKSKYLEYETKIITKFLNNAYKDLRNLT